MAAAYCFGIAMNHPFVDGNKREVFLAMTVFLMLNGLSLMVDPIEAELAVLDLVAGPMSEEVMAKWITANSKPFPATLIFPTERAASRVRGRRARSSFHEERITLYVYGFELGQ